MTCVVDNRTLRLNKKKSGRIIFWNAHGHANIRDLFYVNNEEDILCIYETWSNNVDQCAANFSEEMHVLQSPAWREAERGRYMGGILVATSKKIYTSELLVNESEFLIVKIKCRKLEFLLCVVYSSPLSNFKNFLCNFDQVLSPIRAIHEHLPIFVGGDFNSRLVDVNRMDGYLLFDESRIFRKRLSRDEIISRRGRELNKYMELNGMVLLNGRTVSDCPVG